MNLYTFIQLDQTLTASPILENLVTKTYFWDLRHLIIDQGGLILWCRVSFTFRQYLFNFWFNYLQNANIGKYWKLHWIYFDLFCLEDMAVIVTEECWVYVRHMERPNDRVVALHVHIFFPISSFNAPDVRMAFLDIFNISMTLAISRL